MKLLHTYLEYITERRGSTETEQLRNLANEYVVGIKQLAQTGTKQVLKAKKTEDLEVLYWGASKLKSRMDNFALSNGVNVLVERNSKPNVTARYSTGTVHLYSSELNDLLYNISRLWVEACDPATTQEKRIFYLKLLRKTSKEFELFDFTAIQNSLIHELVHWMDDQRGGVYSSLDATNRRIANRSKKVKTITEIDNISKEEYYNSPHEINAYLIEALTRCLAVIKSGGYICNTFAEFHDFVFESIGKHTMYYTAATKARIAKRLYTIWQEQNI